MSMRIRAAAISLSMVMASLLAVVPAHANRFGPPWMAIVSADQTTLYSDKDRTNPVGPLSKGAMLVVIGSDSDMTQTPDGWVPSSDVVEATQPWIAEVSDASTTLYAKPNAQQGAIRTAKQGDLVRITGVSPGIDGDSSLWWATTDGYVGLHSIQSTSNPAAQQWTLPAADDATNGWWGIAKAANVRAAPATDAPVVGEFSGGEHVKVLSEEQGDDVNGNSTWYRIDGGRYAGAHVHSSLISHAPDPKPAVAPPGRDVGSDPWIVVDRSASTLTLLKDGQPQFTTYVSLGQAGVETPDGTYSTFIKYRADRMTSTTVPNAEHSYDLPNVPFTQYFKPDGSAIHGTYWHDAFGTNQSQGCINLTWTDSEYLFSQTKPQIPADQIGFAVDPEQATPVVVIN
jgi:L,D-transpeptidase catalytic domain/Bacterial SH3 domain